MKREIITPEGITYSFTDGCYYKEFSRNKVHYKVTLSPFAQSGSACTILKITDIDDPNNITAPIDSRTVYYKRFNDFKPANLTKTIKEFIDLF